MIWLDGLDIPLVRFLDAASPRRAASSRRRDTRPEGDALHRYGSNLLPLDHGQAARADPRVFIYPFARRASRSPASPAATSIRTTASSCASSTRRPAASPMPPSAPSPQRCRPASTTAPYAAATRTRARLPEGAGDRATVGAIDAFDSADARLRAGTAGVRIAIARRGAALRHRRRRFSDRKLGVFRRAIADIRARCAP